MGLRESATCCERPGDIVIIIIVSIIIIIITIIPISSSCRSRSRSIVVSKYYIINIATMMGLTVPVCLFELSSTCV